MWTAISAFAARALRRSAWPFLLYSGLLGGVLFLFSCWISFSSNPSIDMAQTWLIADVLAVATLGLGLFIIVPAVVTIAIASERRAGTLDQLRTTPTSPFELATAFVLGVPARIYVLLLGPLALHVVASLSGVLPTSDLLRSLLVLGSGGLFLTTLGLVVGLAPMRDGGGALAALCLAALSATAALMCLTMVWDREAVAWSFLHPAGGLFATLVEHPGTWREHFFEGWDLEKFTNDAYVLRVALLPMASVALSLLGTALLFGAARRRLESPERPLLSKLRALLLFTLSVAAALSPLVTFDLPKAHLWPAGALSALFFAPTATLLALLATPSYELWTLGMRRKHAAPRPWSDEASPVGLLFAMYAVAALLLAIPLRRAGLSGDLKPHDKMALAWLFVLAGTLPLFVRQTIRIRTAGGQLAFLVATGVYHLFQAVVVLRLAHRERYDGAWTASEHLAIELGILLGIAAPVALQVLRPKVKAENIT
jgi:hypothetical protein